MKPTITIVQYLYSGCNTWLRHHEECDCPADKLIQESLDQVFLEEYTEVQFAKDYASLSFKLKTAEEWDEICGPKAEDRALNKMLEEHMAVASEILAALATKERLRGE